MFVPKSSSPRPSQFTTEPSRLRHFSSTATYFEKHSIVKILPTRLFKAKLICCNGICRQPANLYPPPHLKRTRIQNQNIFLHPKEMLKQTGFKSTSLLSYNVFSNNLLMWPRTWRSNYQRKMLILNIFIIAFSNKTKTHEPLITFPPESQALFWP